MAFGMTSQVSEWAKPLLLDLLPSRMSVSGPVVDCVLPGVTKAWVTDPPLGARRDRQARASASHAACDPFPSPPPTLPHSGPWHVSMSLSPGALWAPCLSQHRCHLSRKDCSEVPTQLPTSRPSTHQHVILFNFLHYLESSYLWCFICLPLPVLKKIHPLSRMCHVYG